MAVAMVGTLASAARPSRHSGGSAPTRSGFVAKRKPRARLRAPQVLAGANGDQLRAVWATFHISWALAELGELERSGRLIGGSTGFLQNAGFARSRSDLLCEKGALDALHRRLPADTIDTLIQQGRDTPLEEALSDALTSGPQLSAAPAPPRGSI